ncbi:hypothetical protein L6452_38154 [Arctium lappa]|uniref:Uncharacterized protein n=1 Tax=Arctium lappa TaxID=4217 RepID=A0ACB8Y513_ARCLA|nr:hypothetical protein L6452_38154 [Arctium lappa]
MVEKGCAPNAVTFNALMRNFSHHAMAPKVVELLKKMAENKVTLDASTVSLVVDLLSKDEKYMNCKSTNAGNGDRAAASCLRKLQQAGESGYQRGRRVLHDDYRISL